GGPWRRRGNGVGRGTERRVLRGAGRGRPGLPLRDRSVPRRRAGASRRTAAVDAGRRGEAVTAPGAGRRAPVRHPFGARTSTITPGRAPFRGRRSVVRTGRGDGDGL